MERKQGLKPFFVIPLLLSLLSCGGGSDSCDGTTFVNLDATESVTVSAHSTSGVSFTAFTLAPDEEHKVCGDDSKDIIGSYVWSESGVTAADAEGISCSSCDFCIYLIPDTVETGNCL